ncbi:MAG: mRNA-degrading endonuclease [Candidatus Sungbacteria bacterium RIFCSPLOWO2_02_FULL_54_10]|uniref:mRNA-degrading endonuclease n=2 Tax=Candidatus Sungiibacteriota TaxID=1817917 RepID=A0A1G2L760_9BACT|nr:MAG: mRNA-degrading endonuclease [Candidatus Sungbacteria bacterium RIFCSPHIGHO2_01_FULL_54_26]OHA02663.1 MAG: mRNA-degrading endonuclease [Candidatus Sungbacteria bacterium RIFCSPHIGHO2_02_FULL_53_17]OHA07486.1 MAG: mRNA-degrading endonuclease [Candidatus Sungbacteria bacterium RIFCSPLOWO2_01_FULL_54_21]OHA13454.1 MAG: mRNA-degrading endonuclease [Candidatus Sungbacteria bacterium RIFCSPLOWO2_02_FULL_54_10]
MVKRPLYIPDRGDIAWISFDPQRGREQAKRRPAVVLSPYRYNQKTGLALVCPITAHAKGYPFEVGVRDGKISGVVLSDHMRSVDWRARRAVLIQKLDPAHIA